MVGFCHGGNLLGNHDDHHDQGDDDDQDDDHEEDDGLFPWSHQIQPVMLGAFRTQQNLENFDKCLDRSKKLTHNWPSIKDWLNTSKFLQFSLYTVLWFCDSYWWLHSYTQTLLVAATLGRSIFYCAQKPSAFMSHLSSVISEHLSCSSVIIEFTFMLD